MTSPDELVVLPAMSELPQDGSTPSRSLPETADMASPSPTTRISQKEPDHVGPFRIIEKVGEGGMGIVYKAEQREPVRRIVALKVIKLGMDTKEVVARFQAERQALAMLSHPNVAKVFEAGMTDTGRPYFAMEHVPGPDGYLGHFAVHLRPEVDKYVRHRRPEGNLLALNQLTDQRGRHGFRV
jgi:serine/threonine protein kinase